MTQRTETAAPIASVYCFRYRIAQRFHAAVLTSARMPMFGLLTFVRARLLRLISVTHSGVRELVIFVNPHGFLSRIL